MKKNSGYVVWRSLLLNSLVVSGVSIFQCDRAFSQVTPDDTLGDESSVVNTRDETSDSINGGAIRGQNLFHSFEEFNVGEDRGVYFSNPEAVNNIFSRVTGNNVSNILGTLGVDGAANLFLINPNGIVFGEGASLDVQGSFAATTADGIEFGEQGFFGVSNPESPKLLTINPSAYLFNQVAPGAIANSSKASADSNPSASFDDDFFGLRVPDGQSLLLLGGDVETNGGGLVASGGRINIGAVTGQGVIGLNNNGSLNIPDDISRGNVSLTNGAGFLVAGDGGGDLAIAAKNISLDSASGIYAGILSNLGSPDAQAGDININATGAVNVSEESGVENTVEEGTTGNSGNINVIANSLQVLNGGEIATATYGQGDAGKIEINATDTINFDGKSGVFNVVIQEAVGNAGGIKINASSLTLTNGGRIDASTYGQGDAGKIEINTTDAITLGKDAAIISFVESAELVDAGKIAITTSSLNLTNGGIISTSTFGQGNAGDININASSLNLTNGGRIDADTFGQGNAGDININATDTITFDGENSYGASGISSTVDSEAEGDAGKIAITTSSLNLTNGGQINTDTSGQGNAGDININASDAITFSKVSGILSTVDSEAEGDAGKIAITASSLNLINGGVISTNTYGRGNGGEVEITTNFLNLIDGGIIDTATLGQGNAGAININASDAIIFDGANGPSGIYSQVDSEAEGDAAGITINTSSLDLINGGVISASTLGKGDSGNLSITAENSITLDASTIVNNVQSIDAVGDAGKIKITTGSLSATNGSQINSFTRGQGDAGDITIKATDAVTFDGFDSDDNYSGLYTAVENGAKGNGGNISLTAGNIRLRDDSDIGTNVFNGTGDGGNISITADSVIAFDDSDIFAFAPEGKGGNINLDTPAYFGENFTLNSITSDPDSLVNNSRADINATGAVSGSVTIPDVSSIQNSLTELANDSLKTDELVANSCVVPVGDRKEGKFIITGTQSLPLRPGDGIPSNFPTGEVRSVPEKQSSWQPGDPIVEPQGAYRLANGKLVLSRECSQ
jgi:filamentous hemagglutinin family protein